LSRITVYTDGSCDVRDRIGGYGVVMEYKGNVKELFGGEEDTTISRMELTAPIKALESIKTKNIPIDIYSDSAYVVNCFKDKWYINWERNGWRTSQKKPVENQDLWERLLELVREQREVIWHKVKGHSNIELNELADSLANKGRLAIKEK
jgi:ribonuclease HI